MNVLVSGFGPFDKWKENPSEVLVNSLAQTKEISGANLFTKILPVEFESAFLVLKEEILKVKPNAVISFGLAGIRSLVTPEKIAVNWLGSKSSDNSGKLISGQKIDPDGPDGIFSNLPVEKIQEDLEAVGIKSEVSLSAGSYVCNEVMYRALQMAIENHFSSGFVHLPVLEEDFNLEKLLRTGRTIVETVLNSQKIK